VSWVDNHQPQPDEVQAAFDELYHEVRGVEANRTTRRRRRPLTHERKGRKGRTSPVIDYARSLGPYFVASEVAEQIGMSAGWVRKASRNRWTQAPSYVAPYGDTHLFLYTKEDVKALKEYLKKERVVRTYEEWQKDGDQAP
jgi:hypothetical protein